MAERDVIVVGASSGGVEALVTLVSGLPPTLAAAIFVVLHVRPEGPSMLPAVLNRAGHLPAAHAVDGEPIRRGRIYVAPPAQQLYVERGRIAVRHGPRENLHRPAVDPLFRTAAHHYGARVIGIVLSGALDDGTAGLLAVKSAGGVTIVQDPSDATFSDMPSNAFDIVGPDYCVPVVDLPELLRKLVGTAAVAPSDVTEEVPLETAEEAESSSETMRPDELGTPSAFTCPECHGTLWELADDRALRYRCRVGHAYSTETMVKAQGESSERALWAALRALEERVGLMNRIAERARMRGHEATAAMFEQRSRRIDEDVRAVHDLIVSGQVLEPVGQHDG